MAVQLNMVAFKTSVNRIIEASG